MIVPVGALLRSIHLSMFSQISMIIWKCRVGQIKDWGHTNKGM